MTSQTRIGSFQDLTRLYVCIHQDMSQLGSKPFQFYEQFSSPRSHPPPPSPPQIWCHEVPRMVLPPYLVGVNGIPRCLVFSRGLGLGRGDPDNQVQVLLHAFVQSSKHS